MINQYSPFKQLLGSSYAVLLPMVIWFFLLAGSYLLNTNLIDGTVTQLSINANAVNNDVVHLATTLNRHNIVTHIIAFILLSSMSSLLILSTQRLINSLELEKSQRDQIIDKKTANLRTEIKQHKMARSELQRLATHDPLTGIRNRRHFTDALDNEMQRYQRYQNNFSLLILDLDFFKKINDTHGHDCGDRVLKKFAEQVKKSLRKSDIFARYGGEEFAIIATNTQLDSAKRFADKLVKEISSIDIECDGQPVQITVSIGVGNPSALTKPTAISLIALTDKALNKAKNSGRNRAVSARAQ